MSTHRDLGGDAGVFRGGLLDVKLLVEGLQGVAEQCDDSAVRADESRLKHMHQRRMRHLDEHRWLHRKRALHQLQPCSAPNTCSSAQPEQESTVDVPVVPSIDPGQQLQDGLHSAWPALASAAKAIDADILKRGHFSTGVMA